MSTKFRKFKTWNPDTNQYESALAFEGDLIDDTTASATKTYSSNKIQSLAGAQIDDDETSNTKVWSSGKVYNELESAKSEFVTPTPYEEVTVTEQTLSPHTFYDFGECAELYIECEEPTDTTIVNEYSGCFDSGDTPTDFSFDMGITWNNNIETKANTHYEFNIIYTSNGYFGLIVETEMVTE